MYSDGHFREPAAGVSRCVSRCAVSYLSRLPERAVGRYGMHRYQGRTLARVLMRGRSRGNPGGTAI